MRNIDAFDRAFAALLPETVLLKEQPLANYTSFRIGGPAERLALPRSAQELALVFSAAAEAGIRPRLLGAGTNVLAPDEGVCGVIIVTRDALTGLERLDATHLRAFSGTSLAQTAMVAARNGLSGLEFAHGIPGTVGGGVYMNAGAYGGELRQCVESVCFLHLDGRMETLSGEALGFGYRTSAFASMDGAIVSAELALTPGDEREIFARMRELAQKRRAAQPLELPSAGSAFKRPQGGYAAALIDQAGLKGAAVGGAAVSEKHAGFIVNRGGATAADVLALIALVQRRVYETSGISLEPEIRLWTD